MFPKFIKSFQKNGVNVDDIIDIKITYANGTDIETNIKVDDIISMIPIALNINLGNSFGWPYETEGIWFNNYGSRDFFGPAKTLESNVKRLHVELFGQTGYEVPESIVTISNEIIERTGVGKEDNQTNEEGE